MEERTVELGAHKIAHLVTRCRRLECTSVVSSAAFLGESLNQSGHRADGALYTICFCDEFIHLLTHPSTVDFSNTLKCERRSLILSALAQKKLAMTAISLELARLFSSVDIFFIGSQGHPTDRPETGTADDSTTHISFRKLETCSCIGKECKQSYEDGHVIFHVRFLATLNGTKNVLCGRERWNYHNTG
uniref:Helicase C-terminal domain-containing protein n=1 Tax=Steinernema glaseri TaxID=37863 RepID=A0A1I7Z373_9BILA